MKEFDKHFVENYPNIPLTDGDAIFALHIWIAALDWIMNNPDAYCSGEVNIDREFEKCLMRVAIKKELSS